MTVPLLTADAVTKPFARTVALQGVTMSIDPGEIVAVTGPSGSGKSTLMLCLAGVLVPESGTISYDGRILSSLTATDRATLRRREFGLLLQFGQLLPELTATDNVTVPLLLDGRGRPEARRLAEDWLVRLGAAEFAHALPGELSAGQAQRVAIARALVAGPRVILADEPTGALDSVSAAEVMSALVAVARDTKATMVVITHDNIVAAHADREIVIRDGRAVTQGRQR